MKSAALALFAVVTLGTTPIGAASQWEKTMGARVKRLREQYGSGSKPELRTRLRAMEKEDQKPRLRAIAAKGETEQKALWEQIAQVDERLTAELREIVREHGWPTFDLVGYDGAGAAMLLLIHSPDHDFQRRMIPQLTRLVEAGRLDGTNLATLIDKELTAAGKPQRYGTQFGEEGGRMVMQPVEDPDHLEERRAQYSLMPMKEYKEALAALYKTRVE